jgi:hypothetical protein
MAINVSFNGATIFKPGAYSRTTIDLGGSVPLGPAGLIAIIGESDAGTPGDEEVNLADNRYSADQLVQARNKYKSGPIADALSMLFAPAADAAIPNGAQTVWIYKTNSSVQASLSLATAYGTAEAIEWGVGGNRITLTALAVDEVAPSVTGSAMTPGDADVGLTFDVMLDGVAQTVVVAAGTYADGTAVAAAMTVVGATVSADGEVITITVDADLTAHTNGYGHTMELVETNAGDLALIGLVAALTPSSTESAVAITIDNKRDQVQETEVVGGEIVLTIGSTNVAPTLTIDGDDIILLESALPVRTLSKAAFATLSDVISDINLQSGWSATISNSEFNQVSPSTLDEVTALGALSASGAEPVRLKVDADSVQNLFDQSSQVSLAKTAVAGLPDAFTEVTLSGGAKGSTSPADVIAALDKFTKFHVNSVVPLFSRDASDDIADGLTESGSTYTILGIHQAVKTHISLMKTTKKRSERQGYLAIRDSFVNCKTQAGILADGRLQLAIQDIRQVDAVGTSRWFAPHMLSAIMAGARGGAPIGEPLTFKFMNVSGIRHTTDSLSTPDADITIDFDPDLQIDEAIQAGLSCLEAPQTGGFRIVVDNTTYGRDDNWVWNRGNVIYAADIVAFNFRNAMESRFVGKKNTVTAADISGVAQSVLGTFLAQGITVSTSDAPSGYKDLTVRLEGNTVFIEVTIKLVEGIDFVLTDIFLQRATA